MITITIFSPHGSHILYDCGSSFIDEDMVNLVYYSSRWVIPGAFMNIFTLKTCATDN
jgi:hypothetical protein